MISTRINNRSSCRYGVFLELKILEHKNVLRHLHSVLVRCDSHLSRRRILLSLRILCFIFAVSLLQGCVSTDSTAPHVENSVYGENVKTKLSENKGRNLSQMINAAETAYYSGDWSSAISHYRVLSDISSMDDDSWLRFGNALTQFGRYAEALSAYENSLKLDAQQHKAWFNQSTAYLLLARQSVIKSLQRAGYDDPVTRQMETRLNDLHVMLE